jgi:hypothetical protein
MLYWAELVDLSSFSSWFYILFRLSQVGNTKQVIQMEESGTKKGLEGTGLSLPTNLHGNLRSATGDEQLREILSEIRASKSPVSSLCLSLNSFGC